MGACPRQVTAGGAATRSRWRARAVFVVLCLALVVAPGRAMAEPSEAELKAEFIERFLRFVDWDEAALGPGDLTLCVVGDDPITPYLERIARSRKVKNRKAVIRAVATDKPEKLTGCKVAVIAAVDKKRLIGILGHAGRGVLTIADAPGAALAGTVINFYREDSHIRYEVNVGAAEDAGLILRAKLLRLARLVGEKRPR